MHVNWIIMRRILLLFSIVLLSLSALSQNTSPLKMLNFRKLPNELVDLKALKQETGRDCDFDSNVAALIRVKAQGFSEQTMLDFSPSPRSGIEIIHKKYTNNELWLYVSSNCQGTIMIKYMGEFEFKLPNKLEPRSVYELVLGMETATLVINAVPSTAEIYIDGKKVGTGYGSAAVSVGSEHRYKVVCEGYIPEEDMVKTEKAEKIERQIELRPNFGFITIKSDPTGADVFVDEVKVGVTPYQMKKITPGTHVVELRKTGCESLADMVVIKAGEVNRQFENVKLEKTDGLVENPDLSSPSNFTLTVGGVNFTMVYVEGGTATVDLSGYTADVSERSVEIPSFYIGETEVTQALWRAVMGSEPKEEGGWTEQYGRGDDYPAYLVGEEDVFTFLDKLNERTGLNFRYSYMAEWEYAARGGNKSKNYKYSGSNSIIEVAWYEANSGGKAHPVKTKKPNELGIYDMTGNVRELNEHAGYGYIYPAAGGSWNDEPKWCELPCYLDIATVGEYDEEGYLVNATGPERSNSLGLRLVLESEAVGEPDRK